MYVALVSPAVCFRVMWVRACKIIHSLHFPGFHDCSVEQGSEPTAGEKREDKRNVSRYVGLILATGSTKYLELVEFSLVTFCISCVYETCFDVS